MKAKKRVSHRAHLSAARLFQGLGDVSTPDARRRRSEARSREANPKDHHEQALRER